MSVKQHLPLPPLFLPRSLSLSSFVLANQCIMLSPWKMSGGGELCRARCQIINDDSSVKVAPSPPPHHSPRVRLAPTDNDKDEEEGPRVALQWWRPL